MNCSFSSKIVSRFIAVGLLLWGNAVVAALPVTIVSTKPGEALTIELNQTIRDGCSNITGCVTANITSVVLDAPLPEPPSGSVMASSATAYTYTPAVGVNDTTVEFSYQATIFDGDPVEGHSDTGQIVVIISASGQLPLALLTPQAALNDLLQTVCGANTPPGLATVCNSYNGSTAGERATLLNELAPKEIGGQNQTAVNLAAQKIDDIRKRLAALRLGMQGFDSSKLTLRSSEGNPVSLADLLAYADNERGGGASADSRWNGLGVFVSGNVGAGDHAQNIQEDAYQFKTRGLTVGSDYRVSEKAVAGVALGLSTMDMSVADNGGDLELKGYSAIGYSSYYLNPKLFIEAIAAIYANQLTANRSITDPLAGTTSQANGDTDNNMVSVSAGGGYEIYSQRGLTFNMSGSMDVVASAFDGYAESGAPSANLVIEKRQTTQSTMTINAQLVQAISSASGVLLPQVDVGWRHEFEADASAVEGSFRGDPLGRRFKFSTEKPDTDYFKLNAGFSYIVPGGNTGFVYYEKILGRSGFTEYKLSLGIRVEL